MNPELTTSFERWPLVVDRRIRDLVCSMKKHDWRYAKATHHAAKATLKCVSELTDEIDAWAGAQNISRSDCWRNLIAISPADSLEYFLPLLHAADRCGRSLTGISLSELATQFPKHSPQVGALIRLLDDGSRIDSKVIAALAPGQRTANLQAFSQELRLSHSASSAKYLFELVLRAEALFSAGKRRVTTATLNLLKKHDDISGRLTFKQFRKLPPQLQLDIFECKRARSALLSSDAESRVRIVFEEAQRLCGGHEIPLPETVLELIGAGKLEDPRIIGGLNIWELNDTELSAAVGTCYNANGSDELRARLGTQDQNQNTLSLRFLASDLSLWSSQLEEMSIKDIRGVAELLDDEQFLIPLLCQQLTELNLAQLAESFPSNDRLGQNLVLSIGYVLEKWFDNRQKDERCSLPGVFFNLIGLNSAGAIHTSSKLELLIDLENVLFEEGAPHKLHDFFELVDLRKLTSIDLQGESFAVGVASLARRQYLKQPTKLHDFYEGFLDRYGDIVLASHIHELEASEVRLFMEGPHAGEALDTFTKQIKASGQSPWYSYLEGLAEADQPISSGLKKKLEIRPALVEASFVKCPILMLDVALDSIPLSKILKVAFRRPTLGRVLDGRMPRRDLLAELPWVQRDNVERPRVGAAFELALIIGVRFAPYLVSLALRLPDKGEAEAEGYTFADLYHTYELPKQSGGSRTITAPEEPLKAVQRALLVNEFEDLDRSPYAMGFKRGLSIVDNAALHTQNKIVVNVDIRSFFPNTGFGHIRRVCRQLAGGELSPLAQWLAAEICTFEGGLPTGAPSSPAIANIVMADFDQALGKACKDNGINYSRYADDLTFSGSGEVVRILPFVERLLANLDYSLDPKKTNIFRRGRRQVVTGLVVNEKPNLPRALRKRLRAAVNHRAKGRTPFWQGKSMSDSELLGRIAFLNMVKPEEAAKLMSILDTSKVLA